MSVEVGYKKLKCSRKLLGRENKNEDMQPIGKVINGFLIHFYLEIMDVLKKI